MKTLVVGASGATGVRLVAELLKQNQQVKVVVLSSNKLPQSWKKNPSLTIIERSVLDISEQEMAEIIKDCSAVASCLGHNLSLKGIYGKPRELVTDSIKLLSGAILKNSLEKPVKLVLMNTAGNRNRDLDEVISTAEKMLVGLIRLLLPQHPDNEKAADYLRIEIGQSNAHIEWVVVRPDNLIDNEEVTNYMAHSSPTTSALFKPGKTSRINVGHFMASLIIDNNLWAKWKWQMPVLYNNTELN